MSEGLYKKLVEVMGAIENLKKTGHNNYHNYQYLTESDVLVPLRKELTKRNLFVFSSVDSYEKEGDMTTLITSHTFVDADSGETHTVKSIGQGMSKNDDKGSNKAWTASLKYLFWKNFLIPTNEDPENDGKTSTASENKQKTSKSNSSGFGSKKSSGGLGSKSGFSNGSGFSSNESSNSETNTPTDEEEVEF